MPSLWAQCGQDYAMSVRSILRSAIQLDPVKPRLVLAGSSTFRLWYDAQGFFTSYQVVNAGIGGSCFNDLLAYREALLLDTQPDVLAIYEGDNDLASGVPVDEIVRNAELLIAWFIIRTDGQVPVILVGPKPSPLHVPMASKYKELNMRLKYLANKYHLSYVDTWPILCAANGRPNPTYFKSDRLHLNARGNAQLARSMNAELSRVRKPHL